MNVEKYRRIPYETREHCLICERAVYPVITLPEFPLSEIYVDRKIEEKLGYVDQSFCLCTHCGHGQLTNVIAGELQYGDTSSYAFRSSQSGSGRETAGYFIDFLNGIIEGRTFQTIVEIGCNDLYLLKLLQHRAGRLIGIDPILKGTEEQHGKENIIVIGDFFENVDLPTDTDVVICKDTLEHVSQPKQFLRKIVQKASVDTLFFFAFPILEPLLAECRFDQVFHQHLNYFSLKSIIHMLDELGCSLLDYRVDYENFGTAYIAFRKGGDNAKYQDEVLKITPDHIRVRFEAFKIDMEQTKRRLEHFHDEVIYGYGAALMLPVLSYYLEDDLSCLKCIIDDDRKKDGLYYINLPVRITHRSKVRNVGDSVIMVTAIFSRITARSILTKVLSLKPKYVIYPLRTM